MIPSAHVGKRQLGVRRSCLLLIPGTADEARYLGVAGVPALVTLGLGRDEHEPAQLLDRLPWGHAGNDLAPRKGGKGAVIVLAGQDLAHQLRIGIAIVAIGMAIAVASSRYLLQRRKASRIAARV